MYEGHYMGGRGGMGGVGGRGRGMSIGRERQEEVSLRKAASETQLFWNHVGRNRGTRTYRPSKPQTRSREETSLFGSSTEILLGFVGDAIPVERSGPGCEDIPVLEAFSELVDLPPFLTRNIRLMRYDRPTPIQKHSVPLGMAGLDLMCCAQTGSGKTFAFLLPCVAAFFAPQFRATSEDLEMMGVQMDPDNPEGIRSPSLVQGQIDEQRGCMPRAIILAPTRELASQIHVEARKLCHNSDMKAVVVYGGADIRTQLMELSTGCDIIVATPGRLNDLVDRGVVSFCQVTHLVLDEADRMLDMGFEPQIRRIVAEYDMPPKEVRQTFMFSATFPDRIQSLAREFLREYAWIGVGRVGSTVENIEQRLVEATSDPHMKLQLLMQALSTVEGRTLVFVQKKRTAAWVCNCLQHQGIKAEEIHGDRSQSQREHALNRFRHGSIHVLVATDVAARGLDVPEVMHVVQFDMPISPDDFDSYIHRIGRTGRAGKSGVATSFFVSGRETGEGNGKIAPMIMRLLQENNQQVPEWFRHSEDSMGGGHRSSYPRHGGNGGGGYNNNSNVRFGGRDVRGFQPPRAHNQGSQGNYMYFGGNNGYGNQMPQQPQHQQPHAYGQMPGQMGEQQMGGPARSGGYGLPMYQGQQQGQPQSQQGQQQGYQAAPYNPNQNNQNQNQYPPRDQGSGDHGQSSSDARPSPGAGGQYGGGGPYRGGGYAGQGAGGMVMQNTPGPAQGHYFDPYAVSFVPAAQMPGTPNGGTGAVAGMPAQLAPQLGGHMNMAAMPGSPPGTSPGRGGYYPPQVPVMAMGPHGQPMMVMSQGAQAYGYHGQQDQHGMMYGQQQAQPHGGYGGRGGGRFEGGGRGGRGRGMPSMSTGDARPPPMGGEGSQPPPPPSRPPGNGADDGGGAAVEA